MPHRSRSRPTTTSAISTLFLIHDEKLNAYRLIDAKLMAISKHAYFWLDTASLATTHSGEGATDADWQAAARSFDATYEAVRAVFGSEDSPGIDGDPRLYIVHSNSLGNIGGYFSGQDTLPRVVEPNSNQHEMFYMSILNAGGIGSDYYNATLAHEFQHMIEHHLDPGEALWVNEGMSKLAQQIAGYPGDENVPDYLDDPDQSLSFFGNQLQDYGQAYLFIDYLYEQLGPGFITALAANPAHGLAGVDATLRAMSIAQTADSLYGDMMAAVAIDSPDVGGGRYVFRDAQVGTMSATAVLYQQPDSVLGTVNQYGIDSVRIKGDGPLEITFTGAQTAQLVPTAPPSGSHMWWSGRADMADSTLTRRVDLRTATAPVLTFRAWWSLENGWDYAYVLASTDGGSTWTPLASTSSTDQNPNGDNLGHGLTGGSGGTVVPRWLDESVDLSAYAGQVIDLRFEVITDEGVTGDGFLLDDIAIPQIGYVDDAEVNDGWTAAGFTLIHNRVPQNWLVEAVVTRPGGVQLVPLPVTGGVGTLDVSLTHDDNVLLLITARTRVTLQTAPYRVDVVQR